MLLEGRGIARLVRIELPIGYHECSNLPNGIVEIEDESGNLVAGFIGSWRRARVIIPRSSFVERSGVSQCPLDGRGAQGAGLDARGEAEFTIMRRTSYE